MFVTRMSASTLKLTYLMGFTSRISNTFQTLVTSFDHMFYSTHPTQVLLMHLQSPPTLMLRVATWRPVTPQKGVVPGSITEIKAKQCPILRRGQNPRSSELEDQRL
jgi:hypothetical protein